MTAWDELRARLLDLEDTGCLISYPDPRSVGDLKPPFAVKVQPWALEVAKTLHDRLGDDVRLTVGTITFPDSSVDPSPDFVVPFPHDLLSPEELVVALDGPSQVASGFEVETSLRVKNLTDPTLHIHTSAIHGTPESRIVEMNGQRILGGYRGYLPRHMIGDFGAVTVPPASESTVPLIVGTASTDPSIGYSVPPGDWGLVVYLDVIVGTKHPPPQRRLNVYRNLRSPPLPFRVTGDQTW
jgi:hypothetical protein